MKRSILIILHILAMLLVLAGFVSLRDYSVRGRGISWINSSSFEDSIRFSEMVSSDIAGIKRLAVLKKAFETDNSLDEEKTIVTAESMNGGIVYTVGDILTLSKKFGYTLDNDSHSLVVNRVSDVNNYQIRVTYKEYDPYYFQNIVPGPSQGVMNIRDLCIETLRSIAEYYSLKAIYDSPESNFQYAAYFLTDDEEELVVSNAQDLSASIGSFGKYLVVSSDYSVTTNIVPQPDNIMQGINDFPYADLDGNVLEIGIDTMYLYADRYRAAADSFEGYIKNAYYYLAMLIGGAVLMLITLVPIVRDSDVAKTGKVFVMDRLPLESMILILAFGAVAVYGMFRIGLYNFMEVLAEEGSWNFWCKTAKMVIVYIFCVVILCSMYRRSYHGGVFYNSLLRRGMLALADDSTDMIWSTVAGYGLFVLVNAVCIGLGVWCSMNAMLSRFYVFAAIMLFVFAGAVDIAVYVLLYGRRKQRAAINKALKQISGGNVAYTIDEEGYSGGELEAVRSINSISDGLSHAISEQVRADRLKADLITNVSHDIKTPLTSIINYVDLLKRENIEDEKIKEYIDVLDRKSARLKNLTEDLVEASKASSGNIKLEMRRLDMAELAGQAGGEFDDKFAKRNLEFNLSVPEEPVYILADGRHLWRVFENLLNNAAKYSMEHTRIYADVRKENGNCIFSIKNISQDRLNISPDELTERFIRGDVSRSTEGSGLGLSIAKSLTTLMGGKLVIEIDGDLYKANVILPEYNEEMDEAQKNEPNNTI